MNTHIFSATYRKIVNTNPIKLDKSKKKNIINIKNFKRKVYKDEDKEFSWNKI